MLAFVVTFVATLGMGALAEGSAARDAPETNRISNCVLEQIARAERTTPDKLDSFSKRSANKAMAACHGVKAAWASELDEQLRSDPKFSDPILRKAEVNKIVSTDELVVMILIGMKAR
ncbi:hypothetical protein [Phenylobacterium sp.]|uniref:hypothetical protein n=1 Tax=Phenylobacterium sp. TaxID=1871053 RepID=UPI002730A2F9|nr:hypothetical protein [Phenylobacterium sp.]MDP1873777.1 hypothetical protein [Phenylobacterium sp.]